MKRLILPALAALSLAACASTPTIYQPVGPNGVGYSEYRIEPGRYRIMFQGGSNAPPEMVMDFALRRAADLALAEGYDWFRVSDRFVRDTGYGSSSPQVSFGVGGADYGHHSGVGMGVGTSFDLGGGSSGSSSATIEVFFGRGAKPPGVDVYDARALLNTLARPA